MKIYWSLKTVYERTGLKQSSGSSWRWIHSLVPRWKHSAEILCNADGSKLCLLKATETQQSLKRSRIQAVDTDNNEPHMRFLEFHGMTTAFLGFVLSKACFAPDSRHGRFQDEADVEKITVPLLALLTQMITIWVASGQNKLWLFLAGFVWPLYDWPEGKCKVEISVDAEGHIDLSNLCDRLEFCGDMNVTKHST